MTIILYYEYNRNKHKKTREILLYIFYEKTFVFLYFKRIFEILIKKKLKYKFVGKFLLNIYIFYKQRTI